MAKRISMRKMNTLLAALQAGKPLVSKIQLPDEEEVAEIVASNVSAPVSGAPVSGKHHFLKELEQAQKEHMIVVDFRTEINPDHFVEPFKLKKFEPAEYAYVWVPKKISSLTPKQLEREAVFGALKESVNGKHVGKHPHWIFGYTYCHNNTTRTVSLPYPFCKS